MPFLPLSSLLVKVKDLKPAVIQPIFWGVRRTSTTTVNWFYQPVQLGNLQRNCVLLDIWEIKEIWARTFLKLKCLCLQVATRSLATCIMIAKPIIRCLKAAQSIRGAACYFVNKNGKIKNSWKRTTVKLNKQLSIFKGNLIKIWYTVLKIKTKSID